MSKIKNDAPGMKGERGRNNDGNYVKKEEIPISVQLKSNMILTYM